MPDLPSPGSDMEPRLETGAPVKRVERLPWVSSVLAGLRVTAAVPSASGV